MTLFATFARLLDTHAHWFARRFGRAGPYLPLLHLLLAGLVLLSASRLMLVAWQWTRVSGAGIVAATFLQGVRADLILLGYLLIVPLAAAPLAAFSATAAPWRRATAWWASCALIFIVFMELASPQFIMQFDVRPNRLFIEYLSYPAEVLATLWNGFRVAMLASLAGTVLAGWTVHRVVARASARAAAWPARRILLVWPVLMLLVAMQIRSTLGHRPANPAMFALSGDALVNSLIINSPWSVLDAAYSMRKEANSSEIYGTFPAARVYAEVKAAPWLRGYQFPSSALPTLHWQEPVKQRARPLNLVIVLEESMGATFVASLGGVPVTPELEKLKHEGWWFEQLYATGTRSVRGIEAVIAGYPPTPARSVVKLSLAQLHTQKRPFFSLIFTSSNHEPFEFPDGKISLHEPNKQSVNNAVKYADYALGKFIRQARQQAYWQDTLFLIVADHDNRVYGDTLVPIKKFQIPGLILGADTRARSITTIASQIDLAPTLLSLMGVRSEHPMIGRDLARDSTAPGRALLQFDNYFAWLEGEEATILRPGQAALLGQYDHLSGELKLGAAAPSAAKVERAMAHVILPSLLYREQRYRLAP